ncbi:PH domain-containing protein [Euzebya sp.]|uniref:PH domain-containing protein n=1 Tax=Euzebya sp. TaxID=1971409 RepID=UPI003515E4D4
MGYPTKLLNDEEQIVLDMHPHWRIFLGPGLLLLVALAVLVVIAAVVQPDEQLLTILAAVPLAVGVVWFAWRYTVWRTTHFVVTTDRVIYRSGVVSKSGQNIPLERINNVAFSQTVLERLLRVGDLVIESAGETGRQTFDDVANPSRVENRIYAEMERAQARDATRAGRAGISVADELTKLEDLRRRGVIDEAEFAAQKARLLS